jgi:hypothetical protein
VSAILDLKQLKRVSIRVETVGRLMDLKGFSKGHTKPVRDSAAARKFIAQIAAGEIEADINETYRAIRESFGFKRRQIESSTDGCSGVIHTPTFDYSVGVNLDPRNVEQIIWRREVGSFRDPSTIRAPEFMAAFGNLFNMLVLEFARPIRVDKLVDRIEDEDLLGWKVDCASDASACEITFGGFGGLIRVNHSSFVIEGSTTHAATFLLDQFVEFIKQMNERRRNTARNRSNTRTQE